MTTPTTSPIKLYSKSSVERDWKCPRSYYYAYEYDGTGIQSEEKGFPLFIGSALHDALAVIAEQERTAKVDIDIIAKTAWDQVYDPLHEQAYINNALDADKENFAKEQSCLVEGLIRGFYKHMWPKLMAEYTIWLIEEPLVYKHGSCGMMSKSDLVLERKADGSKWYFEYKSTSSKREEWIKSWESAIQVHSSVRALEDAFPGEDFAGVIIQGLYKGYVSYGRQNSPFCYAYVKYGQPPFTKDQYFYEFKSGFRKVPVWEMEGGVAWWVEQMPEEIIMDQFPQTPPIFVNDHLIDNFFRQQEHRQTEIQMYHMHSDEETKAHLMDSVFPQRFDQCSPSFGFGCNYRPLCHGPDVSPYDLGFVKRDTAHQQSFIDKIK